MHVRPDGLDGVEPQAVNQIEIAGCERGRMGAEVIGVGAPAAVMDDEPDVERLGLVGPFPRFAQQARLVGGRQRRRFADVDVGRAQPDDRADNASTTLRAGTISSRTGTADALGEGDDVRQQPPLVRRWVRVDRLRPRRRRRRAAGRSSPRRPDRRPSGARPPRAPAHADCGPAPARSRAGPRSDRATARPRAADRTVFVGRRGNRRRGASAHPA